MDPAVKLLLPVIHLELEHLMEIHPAIVPHICSGQLETSGCCKKKKKKAWLFSRSFDKTNPTIVKTPASLSDRYGSNDL